ncbi:hypothetical protein GCM10010441_21550 [Kitasatospora paracochleata]|uniref:DUF2442 domain-containing protein n=1 Tax=Kitasatospora paracochleata TaxID=58354 RepID=A0ABT1J1H4_9ACTN|nr:hypothetical protein [Kitasatospora paracochleata]MCP2310993.1 hypothetical protein [Kitasatospora paracochleata]
MADHYPYRITTRTGDLLLIWRLGEGDDVDRLVVDGLGRLRTFPDLAAMSECCRRNGWELVWEDGEDTAALDLAAVRRWMQHPRDAPVREVLLLDAWNFFEDLSRSLTTGAPLPEQGPVHNSAYDKLFGGTALDPTADDDDSWTDEEAAAVRELLRAGMELWDTAARESVAG